MSSIIDSVLPFVAEHLGTIFAAIAGLIGSWIYKGKADKDDAIASLKTGVMSFFQDNPEIKAALVDGKVTKEEWAVLFQKVGPVAAGAATKGGAKILKRWTGPVTNKYIEAVSRELAVEFKEAPVVP